ncbi:MAG: hypothetical protein GF416_06035 [Candidatus Altiarchaeales archaeon]|nr:hypothetical protein [Candidatus Altiarchaeales archaeon]MBD3416675.1 hypothetical protein [Candidatus Altiarchaeales archaeon]
MDEASVLEGLRSSDPYVRVAACRDAEKHAEQARLPLPVLQGLIALRFDATPVDEYPPTHIPPGEILAEIPYSDRGKLTQVREHALNATHNAGRGNGKKGMIDRIAEEGGISVEDVNSDLRAQCGRDDTLFLDYRGIHQVAAGRGVQLRDVYARDFPEDTVLRPMVELLRDKDYWFRRYGVAFFMYMAGKRELPEPYLRHVASLMGCSTGEGGVCQGGLSNGIPMRGDPDVEVNRLAGEALADAAEIQAFPEDVVRRLHLISQEGTRHSSNASSRALINLSDKQELPVEAIQDFGADLSHQDDFMRKSSLERLSRICGRQRFPTEMQEQLAFTLNDESGENRELAGQVIRGQLKKDPQGMRQALESAGGSWRADGKTDLVATVDELLAAGPPTTRMELKPDGGGQPKNRLKPH